jgi:hypothetical protein
MAAAARFVTGLLSLCTTDFDASLAGLGGAGFVTAVKPNLTRCFLRSGCFHALKHGADRYHRMR